MLEADIKIIDHIQSILQSKKVKNLSKRDIEAIENLTIVFRNYDRNAEKWLILTTNAITITNLTILAKIAPFQTRD